MTTSPAHHEISIHMTSVHCICCLRCSVNRTRNSFLQ